MSRALLATAVALAAGPAIAAGPAGADPSPPGPAEASAGSPASGGFFEGDCPAIIVYGSRGSGQPLDEDGGVGPEIHTIHTELAAVQPSGEVGLVRNTYEAIPFDVFDPDLLENFVDSVQGGVDIARDDLDALRDECPGSKIAAIGYSQGADVTRRAVDGLDGAGGQIKVFLLGDPNFSPDESGIDLNGNFDPDNWAGMARTGVDLGVIPPIPDIDPSWGAESWCHGAVDGTPLGGADPVCQFGGSLNLEPHLGYGELDGKAIAWRIASWAGFGATSPIPTAHLDGVTGSGIPCTNVAHFDLSAAGSPGPVSLDGEIAGTEVTIGTVTPSGPGTWDPELPMGTAPRFRVMWGDVQLVDRNVSPAC